VREGDRLILTIEDKTRSMTNGTAVTRDRIEGGMLHLSGRDRDHVIAPDDPMRERLGHGAVLNMHRHRGLPSTARSRSWSATTACFTAKGCTMFSRPGHART
jgi:hypothetical protein